VAKDFALSRRDSFYVGRLLAGVQSDHELPKLPPSNIRVKVAHAFTRRRSFRTWRGNCYLSRTRL